MFKAAGRFGHWLYQQPALLLSLTSFFWAANSVVARAVVGHVPPVALSWLRWAGAFCVLLPFAWRHLERDWPAIRGRFGLMTLLALCGISAYNTMAYWGLQYTEVINALLIQSTGPLFIALWALVLFGQRLTRGQTFGILTSLVGVVVIICRGDLGLLARVAFNQGDLWYLAALLVFGVYACLSKTRPEMHPLSFLAFTIGWGTALLTPLYVWEISTGATLTLDASSILALGYVMVFPSVLAYLFYNRGIELVGPNRSAPYLHLIPLFGSVLAILTLGERPQIYHGIGCVLVLGGVALATRR